MSLQRQLTLQALPFVKTLRETNARVVRN
jgi:hypothetical protein